MEQPVPGISFPVFERSIAIGTPFLEQHRSRILSCEVGAESLLKAAAKDHGGPRFFLPPAVEIAVAIAARAAQVLADLGVAIRSSAFLCLDLAGVEQESSSHSPAGAKASRF